MRGFEANNCRLCEKAFCCEECRAKHEVKVHKVCPSCDICVYGQIYLGNIEEGILPHLVTSHLPLHCVYCKKIFKNIEDILLHRKCPILQYREDSPKTPFRDSPSILITSEDNQSPVLQEFQAQEHLKYLFNLATSTPMSKGNEINIFDKSREPLTPVDKPADVISKSIIKNITSTKSENSSNRRVTFGNTQSIDCCEPKLEEEKNENRNTNESKTNLKDKTNNSDVAKNENAGNGNLTVLKSPDVILEKNNEEEPKENSDPVSCSSNICTPSLSIKSDNFYSAKSECPSSDCSAKGNTTNKNTNIEGFTPVASNLKKIPKGHIYKNDINIEESPELSPKKQDLPKDNYNEISMDICTPEPLKNTRTTRRTLSTDMTPIIENTKESNETESEVSKNDVQSAHTTMWLSAVNINGCDSGSSEDNEKENIPETNLEPLPSLNVQSPPLNNRKRVSIIIPSPIVKVTDVKMTFEFPTHLSSTPISNNTVEIQSTKVSCQTPFRTPQGKFFEIVQRRLVQKSNLCRNFTDLPITEPKTSKDSVNSPQEKKILDDADDNVNVVEEEHKYDKQEQSSESQISVSSMTESSLWTSMTNIVKSMFGGFTHSAPEISYKPSSTSFKRQLSDCEFEHSEHPRLKRFKLTDIKCRRPIRHYNALIPLEPKLASKPALASIEIVKSVSTLYGGDRIRIQCDKSTQTDDYLMEGWCPRN